MMEEALPDLPVTFHTVNASNLADLRILNQILFPVKYQEEFYRKCAASGSFTQLAFYGAELVGAVACQLEAQIDGTAKLYIMTLGVLAPYRGRRVGSRLLHRVLEVAAQDPNIREAYLHVHTSNTEAIKFYTSAFGFQMGPVLRNYYRRIDPPDAVILQKNLIAV